MRAVIGVIRIVVLLTFSLWLLLMARTKYQWEDAAGKGRMEIFYNKLLLRLCGLKYRSVGHLPKSVAECGLTEKAPGMVAVANHISFLDIFTLQASSASKFIAKAEIAKWPVFGAITTAIGSIYINRRSRKAILEVNEVIKKTLEKREVVGLFAEGTTTFGNSLLPIKSNFFKAPCEIGATIQPMLIVYTSYGKLTERYSFAAGMPLFTALWNVTTTPGGEVTIHFLESFSAAGLDRHEVAKRCDELMRARIKEIWGDKYIESDPRVNQYLKKITSTR
ncbi:MAG: 1-acyl-sn-glycerol-3-phosphate acyltransferase [Burkholderiales bacterium]|nr:1-acyl-sn-glycerol-3-phosphate acyltransferase [Burkholderiales bacterium]